MNIISFLIISTIIGLLIFISVQNILFLFSKNIREKEIEERVKNFIDLINRASKISSDYFYFKYFLGLSNLTVENNIITISINGKSYSYYIQPYIKDTKIIEASDYCVIIRANEVEIYDCEENVEDIEECNLQKCKKNSIECVGPNPICINDEYCNTFIKENCRNSPNDCKSDDINKVCCPDDPSADKYGFTSKRKLGEECYCDSQCESGLKCNVVSKNFKNYKSNRACCPDGYEWNGIECKKKEYKECSFPCEPDCLLPIRFDWRNVNGKNYLNPIRNQGSCGACWAFATIGSIESVYNIEYNCPACNKDLSEQQLVSNNPPCCNYCGSCNGGLPHFALEYIRNFGVVDESCYPYAAIMYGIIPYEKCDICNDYPINLWKINNFDVVKNDINEIKRALICNGPLVVASFNWAHAVVLVGYDDDSEICKRIYGKSGCWIIRNSWGGINGIIMNVYHERGYGYIPYEDHPYSDIISYAYYVKGIIPP